MREDIIVIGGVAVITGGERRTYAAPSPTGYAPVRDGVDSGDANANKDAGGTVKGGGFYGGEEENYNGRQGRSRSRVISQSDEGGYNNSDRIA